MPDDLKVAQLLSSRICHDLVGPAGAVNAGLELLEDGLSDANAPIDLPALDLIKKSAGESTRRLAFFRIAFGFGAGAKGEATFDQARELAAGFLAGGKVVLDWPEALESQPPGGVPASMVKVLLNMVLIATEALPRGGTVGLNFAALDDGLGMAVLARGEGAALKDDICGSLAENAAADGLTARNVHGYLAQTLARGSGALIEHSQGSDGEIQLAVMFPNATDC
ncbi:MAG: hypothetical protein HQ512_01180 [Rhodospirillales bacterium]|nr:hypothetical protein [Rhodospirillales bacterium]